MVDIQNRELHSMGSTFLLSVSSQVGHDACWQPHVLYVALFMHAVHVYTHAASLETHLSTAVCILGGE